MERISNSQLFTLLILYEIGSTVIFGFSVEAGRSAWISVLISTFIGVLINIVYFTLMNMNPGLTLIEWFPDQLGVFIGIPISWMYALEFIYDGGRALSDLHILIPSTILPKTPIFVVELIFISIIAYALFSGLETIARLSQVFVLLIVILSLTEFIFLFQSDVINYQYMKPFMGKGWENILKSVFPLGITQTFGQSIEFAMIWPFIKDSKKVVKSTMGAIILAGLFIAFFDIIAILVFGENTFSNSIFPMYRLIKVINVGNFIENLDAINVLYFLSTLFFKLYIHLYCAVKAIQQLTYTKNKNVFIIPVCATVLYLAMNMAKTASEHIEVGTKIVPYNIWLPLFYILPIILLMISWFRKRVSKLN